MTSEELGRATAEALALVSREPGVVEVEVFASANRALLTRLNYTSHLPCNGLEEPKSMQTQGVGLRIAFKDGSGITVGFGQETGSLNLEAVESAYLKAKEGAVHDPDFQGLPSPSPDERSLRDYHDPRLLNLADTDLVGMGWKAIQCALEEFERSPLLRNHAPRELGLILGGDVTILQEQIALSSTRLRKVLDDTTTILFSSLTSMIERMNSKGSGWSTGTSLESFDGSAGAMAVRSALQAGGGTRIESGTYQVVLAPQAVADIMNNIVIPSLRLDTFYVGNSTYQGKLGKPVASETLSVRDCGNDARLAASKAITCEGIPTGKTDLIVDGRLVGLLSNDYETKRMLHDNKAHEKLGVDPHAACHAIAPRNGFRFGQGGGRNHALMPSIASTNMVIEGSRAVPLPELLKTVRHGIYVGRIWYTYPINGLKAGDFTATIVGDSYLIREGRLAEPLKPNTVRINDTVHSVLNRITGIEDRQTGIVLWAADEVVYAPHIAVAALKLSAIAAS